jgi:hypothetical protein
MNSLPLRPTNKSKKKEATAERGLNIISPIEFEREANEESVMVVVVTEEGFVDSHEEPPEEIGYELLDTYKIVKRYFDEVVKLYGRPKITISFFDK